MDRKERKRVRKLKTRFDVIMSSAPHVKERNPTPEQERESAQWAMDSVEMKSLLKHMPVMRKNIVRWCRKFGAVE